MSTLWYENVVDAFEPKSKHSMGCGHNRKGKRLYCHKYNDSAFISFSEIGLRKGWPLHSVGGRRRQRKSWGVIVGGLRGERLTESWGSKMCAAAGRESQSQELLPLICSPAHLLTCIEEGWPMHSVGGRRRRGKSWEVIVGRLRDERRWGSKMCAVAGRLCFYKLSRSWGSTEVGLRKGWPLYWTKKKTRKELRGHSWEVERWEAGGQRDVQQQGENLNPKNCSHSSALLLTILPAHLLAYLPLWAKFFHYPRIYASLWIRPSICQNLAKMQAWAQKIAPRTMNYVLFYVIFKQTL